MTDTASEPAPKPGKAIPKGAGNIWTDIGPVLAFVVVYNVVLQFPENNGGLFSKEDAIYWATGVFMAAVAVAIGWTLMKGRRLPPMLIITGVVVAIFGTLTIWLQNKTFAFMKPTVINLLFAGTILGSLAIGRNIWKTAFEHAFSMPDRAWKVFALRWAAFYVLLAIINEAIWRGLDAQNSASGEAFWSNSKLFLTIPMAIVFMIANLPFLMKHSTPPAEAGGEDQKAEKT
jgi:intracellular septation protein